MKTISVITTSKGRLHHLRKTLPPLMELGADEVIVVDYGCPDGSGQWAQAAYPNVRVVEVGGDPEFSASRARNLGAAAAGCEWLVFVDADIKVHPAWMDWMGRHVEPGAFYRAADQRGDRHPDTFGTFICAKADFDRIGGYDEVFRGWGGEDVDIYYRLEAAGLNDRTFPVALLDAIPHGDEERAGWPGLGDKIQKIVITKCYSDAKLQLARIQGTIGHPPVELRQELMDQTHDLIRRWFAEGATRALEFRYALRKDKRWLPTPYALETELTFTMRLSQLEAVLPPE